MPLRSGGQAVTDQLLAAGTDVVFGIPGAQLDHAMDALAFESARIRFIHTRHEQGAGFMADGYARTTGRPGVMMVVPGPGFLNAASALATAWACSSPVVAIIGSIPRWSVDRRAGVLHELEDQTAIVRGLTGWHRRVSTADEIPEAVADALAAACSGRSRPAAVEIPADLFAQSTDAPTASVRTPDHQAPSVTSVTAAAEALDEASFPVLVVGNGVTMSDAGPEALRLAERLGAPIALTTNGKAALSHDHPLVLPQAAARELLPLADVVLAVGTRLVNAVGRPIELAPNSRLVLVNADEHDLGGWRDPAVAIHADARLGLGALADAVGDRRLERAPTARTAAALAAYREQVATCEPLLSSVEALRAALPPDGIVVSDLTQAGYLANAVLPVHHPRSYLTSGWQGTLGYAYPTALGAKVAHPDRPVLAIVGDGGFGFTLSEMATAARHGIAVVAVCFRDDAYGNVRRTQHEMFAGRTIGTDLVNPDFVKLAEAYGLSATRATTADELESAVRRAIGDDRPTVVEVPIGAVPSPWHLYDDRPTTTIL